MGRAMAVRYVEDYHQQFEDEAPSRASRALLVAPLLIGALGVALAAVQFMREHTTGIEVSPCASISNRIDRLACYDATAYREPTQPARSSSAPPLR